MSERFGSVRQNVCSLIQRVFINSISMHLRNTFERQRRMMMAAGTGNLTGVLFTVCIVTISLSTSHPIKQTEPGHCRLTQITIAFRDTEQNPTQHDDWQKKLFYHLFTEDQKINSQPSAIAKISTLLKHRIKNPVRLCPPAMKMSRTFFALSPKVMIHGHEFTGAHRND